MKIAFVGVKRNFQALLPEYINFFVKYHLELPYYYAESGNDVIVTTIDYSSPTGGTKAGEGWIDLQNEKEFIQSTEEFDVVIHWRRWYPELYRPEAINVINCQDHSFGPEWLNLVREEFSIGALKGILCFPGWHKRNLLSETGLPESALIDGLTLGVDTDIYCPSSDKDPYQMLWASDPGRGLNDAIGVALGLFHKDKRYRLNICYPDYARPATKINHPALIWHGSIPNGPKLWDVFNRCGILPYTSSFYEPSSRAHRQAQAAGSLVIYPTNRGTPSELIEDDVTGLVRPLSVNWVDIIDAYVCDGRWKEIGSKARDFAISENWEVQARRFENFFKGIKK